MGTAGENRGMKHPIAYYQADGAPGGGSGDPAGGSSQPPAGAPGADAAGNNDAQTDPPTEPTEVKDLPEWAQKHIRDLRSENASHRQKAKEAADAAQKAAEEKAKHDGEWQKLAEQYKAKLEEKDAEIAKRDRLDMIRKVAAKYKLPDALSTRLQGDTEEAMEADAKELAKALPAITAPNDEAGNRKKPTPPIDKEQTYVFQRPGDVKRTLRRED